MSVTQVVHSISKREYRFPVSGAGADIFPGALLMKGATSGTNFGVLIPVTASSNARVVGVLKDLHDYSVSGDATYASALVYWYPEWTGSPLTAPSHMVELVDTATVVKVPYSLASTVAVASNAAGDLTVTSQEVSYDGGFVYVNAGTGIGQLGFVIGAGGGASGHIIMSGDLTTSPDSTSKLTKIMPLFLDTPVWKVSTATAPTLLDSTAAAGTGRAVCMGSFISRNGQVSRLDPKAHHNLQSLNSASGLEFFSELHLVDTIFHPIS